MAEILYRELQRFRPRPRPPPHHFRRTHSHPDATRLEANGEHVFATASMPSVPDAAMISATDVMSAVLAVAAASVPRSIEGLLFMIESIPQFENSDDQMAEILRRKTDVQRLRSVDSFWRSARVILRTAIVTEQSDWDRNRVNVEICRCISSPRRDGSD